MGVNKGRKSNNNRLILLYLIGTGVFTYGVDIVPASGAALVRTSQTSDAKQLSELGEQKTDFGQGWYVCADSEKNCTMWNAIKVINLDPYKDIKYHIGGLDLTFPNARPTLTSQDKRLKMSLGMLLDYDMGGFIGPDKKYGKSMQGARGYIRHGRFIFAVQYDDFVLTVTPEYGEFFRKTYNLYGANLAYKGFKNTIITIGLYQPGSPHEFMSRPAIVDAVRNISGAEPRLSFGVQHFNKRYTINAFVTGQRLGGLFQKDFQHNQIGGVFKAIARPVAMRDVDLYFGLSSYFAFHGNNKKYGLSARQDTDLWWHKQYIRTGTLNGVDNVSAIGPEVGFRWKRVVLQSEFYNMRLGRTSSDTEYRPNLNFKGWYILSSYTIFGQPRSYNQVQANFNAPVGPTFNPSAGYWGALEWSARWSVMDLNSHESLYSSDNKLLGVDGGKQTVWSTGLNWAPSSRMHILLEYNHVHATGSKGDSYNLYGRNSNFLMSRLRFSF